MSLAVGHRMIGRVQRKGSAVVRFDTVHVDSVIRIDSLDWYHIHESDGTAAPRPDWIGGTFLASRPDGLYTPMVQIPPVPGVPIYRKMRYPVAVGDTAIDFGWFQEASAEGNGTRAREAGIVTAIDEEIEVPAGRFTAFHVQVHRMTESGDPAAGQAMYTHLWFSPGPGLIRAESRNAGDSVDQVWELVGR